MSGKNRKVLYQQIVKRDGDKCNICQVLASEHRLVIDHVDNNNANNVLGNLQLLCYSCNGKKNPRGKSKKLSYVSVCENAFLTEHEPTPELKKNQECEPRFRKWAEEVLHEYTTIPLNDLINAGAEIAQCSQLTALRYFKKMSSFVGIFEVFRNEEGQELVRFNTKYLSKQNKQRDINSSTNIVPFGRTTATSQG